MNRLSNVFANERKGYGVFKISVKKKSFFKVYRYLYSTSNRAEKCDKESVSDNLGIKETDPDVLESLNKASTKVSSMVRNLKINQIIDSNKALRLTDTKSVSFAFELLKNLSKNNSRSVPVLTALANKLHESINDFNLKQCSELLFFLANLSYKDKKLIDAISDQIINVSLKDMKGGVLASSVLHSYGTLKYRNPFVMDHLLKIILNDKSVQKIKIFLNALMTSAIINYKSPHLHTIIEELSKLSASNFTETKSYLDFVWSCVILNEFPLDHISHVLSKEYTTQINVLAGALGKKTPINLKLYNINSAALNLIPNYNGPLLEVVHSLPQMVSKSKSEFCNKVLDGICHIFSRNEYFALNKDIKAGFYLDIECCIDSEGNAVLLQKSQDLRKTGILLLDFNDFCLNEDKNLTGITDFKQRIIEALNYKLVTIPYTDFNNLLEIEDKVKYLQKKLNCLHTAY